MRRLLAFVGVLAMIAGFLAAVVGLLAALEFDSVKAAQPEPQSIRLADLAKNGPGDNAHVEVTEFTFGKPVKIEKEGRWDAVWVPLFVPRRTKPDTPPAFLHTTLVHDQAELDTLLEQKSFRALVGSATGDSRWNVAPSVMLYEPFPKLGPSKTLVLTDAAFVLEGKVVLPTEKLLNPQTAQTAWMVTGGAGGVGVLGLLAWLLARRQARPAGGGKRKVDLLDASRLPDRTPTSTHEYLPAGAMKRAGAYIVAGLLTFVFGVGAVSVAATAFKKGQTGVAFGAGVGALLMLACTAGMLWVIYNEVFCPITKVAVYRGGIRWQRRDRVYTALWSDIEAVYRQTTEIYVNGQHRGTCKITTIELCNGKYLYFDGQLLTDYDMFADTVQSIHGGYALRVKQHQQAESGVATFGDVGVRVDGVNVGGTFIPWSGLERFGIENGQLGFYSSHFAWSKCRSFALKEIPNYAVLLDMLRAKALCY